MSPRPITTVPSWQTGSCLNPSGYQPEVSGLDTEHQALARLEELVLKALDVLDNRVDAGLRCIAATQLVDLAGDRLYGYNEFGEWQAAHLARQAAAIAVR